MKNIAVFMLVIVSSLYTYKLHVDMALKAKKTKQTKEHYLEKSRKHLFEAEKHMISMQSYTVTLKAIKGEVSRTKEFDALAEQTFERAMYHALSYKYEMGQARAMREQAQILILNK